MPDNFKVGKITAVAVGGTSAEQKKITNAYGGKLYYKTAADVDTGDTELAVGSSVTVDATNWLISESESNVIVETLRGSASQDVSVSDDVTVGDTLTVTGVTTPSGGVAAPSAVPGFFTWQPTTAETGTDTAFAEKKLFTASIFIPVNKTIKGIGYLLGAGGGTNKVIAALFDATGAKVANTSEATEGTVAGSEKTAQEIDLTSTYAAKGPAVFFIGITANGATAKLRTVPANTAGSNLLTAEISLATKNVVPASVTAPTSFTAAKGPVAWVY